MELPKIKNYLIRDLRRLKDRKGFLRANTTNFNWLFGRDSLISAWQLLDWNPEICKATLAILAKFQGEVLNDEKEEEPGKILHETDFKKNWHPGGYFPFPYYGSIDSTPLFLIVFSFYFRKTKDLKFLNFYWGNIIRAVHWLEEYGDRDKDFFLEYERKNPKGLFHQGWKDSFENHLKITPPVAIVEAQGYHYAALSEVAHLAEVKKDAELARSLRKRADILKKEFNKRFWMPKEKYFALALDGEKQQRKAITSNPGLLLFTGIVEEDKIESVVSRLFQEDLWTPYGIRTHSILEPDFSPFSYHLGSVWPHDNWMIAEGLRKLGKKEEFGKIKEAILRVIKEIDYRYFPEYYAVVNGHLYWSAKAGHLQAWTIGAIFNFLEITPTLGEKVLRQIPSKVLR